MFDMLRNECSGYWIVNNKRMKEIHRFVQQRNDRWFVHLLNGALNVFIDDGN